MSSGIRPMTMPAVSTGSQSPPHHNSIPGRAGGATPDMGSGGGTLPPPEISEEDIIGGMEGEAPNYTWDSYGVPVGAQLAFEVGSTYSSFSWSGGTEYGYYMTDPASSIPAPAEMRVGGTPTWQNVYGFTVGATEQQYTVKVTVTSAMFPGQEASSTVTFSSHRPPASLSMQWWGANPGITFDNDAGGGMVQLRRLAKITYPCTNINPRKSWGPGGQTG